MLTIEQFQNKELCRLQSKLSYNDILKYNISLMKFLVSQGILKDEEPEIMAAQFCWPISMWINLCDREPERETEVMELMSKHILQFFRIYKK